MSTPIDATLFAGGLFLGMLLLLEVGRRVGMARLARDADGARAGVGVVDNAVFALLGLLIAFTFSGAAQRFDMRRKLIVEEANAVSTAYLRLDLLPPEAQPALKELLRRYVDSRLEVYRQVTDRAATHAALQRSTALQGEIWRQAVAATEPGHYATILLLPALNEMIDVTTTRTVAAQTHPPTIIYLMLAGLALISAMLAGYDMAGGASRNWVHMVGLSLIVASTVYIILDLEFPRAGWIRIDALDEMLVEARDNMK
ncbi:MAG: DUF4239 domain-containing protein [bacterium]